MTHTRLTDRVEGLGEQYRRAGRPKLVTISHLLSLLRANDSVSVACDTAIGLMCLPRDQVILRLESTHHTRARVRYYRWRPRLHEATRITTVFLDPPEVRRG